MDSENKQRIYNRMNSVMSDRGKKIIIDIPKKTKSSEMNFVEMFQLHTKLKYSAYNFRFSRTLK